MSVFCLCKQKTAYELRISDWRSDVCSSDLEGIEAKALQDALMAGAASKALESFGPRIIAQEYQPARVSVANARQHLGVTETLLPNSTKLSITAVAHKVFDEAAAKGHDGSDIASVAELWPR